MLHDEHVFDAETEPVVAVPAAVVLLQAAVSEYCAASDAAGIPPPTYLQLLSVDLLLQQEQHYQAVQLLYSQPGGSARLAQHLLEKAGKFDSRQAGRSGVTPGSAFGSGGDLTSTAAAVGAMGGGGRSGGGVGVFDTANPSAAMALELALDVMTRQAVPELRPVGPGVAGAAAAAAAAGGSSQQQQQQQPPPVVEKASTAALVRQLLDIGEAVQAARIARTAGGIMALGIPPAAFLEAAAARRDLGTLAAVYRVMRPHVVEQWPDFESARQALCGAA